MPELSSLQVWVILVFIILITGSFLFLFWKRGTKLEFKGLSLSFSNDSTEGVSTQNLWQSQDGKTWISYHLETSSKTASFGFHGTFLYTKHEMGLMKFSEMLDHHVKDSDPIIVNFLCATRVYSKMMAFIVKHNKPIKVVCTFDQYSESISLLHRNTSKVEIIRVFKCS